MARLSKTQSFTIHEDAGIPTPDPEQQDDPFDDRALRRGTYYEDSAAAISDERASLASLDEEQIDHDFARYGLDDGYRRASALTRTSVSSVPESTWQDEEQTYVPPLIRPSFMRPESVRRMQMTSPPPFRSSPRQSSVLRRGSSRSRMNTPRSAQARGSPRPRRQASERSEVGEAVVMLPWSQGAVQDLLPERVRADVQLLRSKVTETMLARGVLIPHPREEYELLEERLLEAMELKDERVTKCGHFRGDSARDSVLSASSDEGEGSDSGLGSSVEGSVADADVCSTCSCVIKTSKSGVSSGRRNWSIRVYAANGLMRASAWAAAWNEMESVDVEILPWVYEETRKLLHERSERDARDEALREFEDNARQLEVRQSHLEKQKYSEVAQTESICPPKVDRTWDEGSQLSNDAPASSNLKGPKPIDLPRVYSPSQIPLSVLLKNYAILLARDPQNVAIFFLGLLALWFVVSRSVPTTSLDLGSANSTALNVPSIPTTEAQAMTDIAGDMVGNASEWVLPMVGADTDNAHDTGVESPIILVNDTASEAAVSMLEERNMNEETRD
ncbi:hypothetical protein LTR56_016635 [Elasticomyces elasticus]|nr:hypothetical protein LTR56_016635 [Elasticomyces elasticus]KAK3641531.1 hypothetical protein LTR22_016532 [Elasticomyces elasticus]KAK4921928.1 hypothetical protein LTR49_010701 [Elasticomyces elasticus]KAK5758141.1 hypothetical protein LTS12_011757 [Elasticomyces elasticus]